MKNREKMRVNGIERPVTKSETCVGGKERKVRKCAHMYQFYKKEGKERQ